MIVHAVQFDRPIANAWLGEDFDSSTPGARPAAATHSVNASEERSQSQSAFKAIERLLNEIACGVSRLETQTTQCKSELQALSIGLATMIVTELVGSSDAIRIARVEKLLSESLDRAQTPIAAFVHPDDFLQLGEYLESLELDVRSDPSVATGECRVEFQSYDLVSNLQHQLQQIEDGLREVLNDA